jgi:hypothetical protein
MDPLLRAPEILFADTNAMNGRGGRDHGEHRDRLVVTPPLHPRFGATCAFPRSHRNNSMATAKVIAAISALCAAAIRPIEPKRRGFYRFRFASFFTSLVLTLQSIYVLLQLR